jgi:hypothetical protein
MAAKRSANLPNLSIEKRGAYIKLKRRTLSPVI